MDAKAVGQRIARARREKGWTQRQLAEHLHISDRTVSKWERGAGLPDVALLVPLADALGLTVTELLDGARETVPEAEGTLREALALAGRQARRSLRRNLTALAAAAAAVAVLLLAARWCASLAGERWVLRPPEIQSRVTLAEKAAAGSLFVKAADAGVNRPAARYVLTDSGSVRVVETDCRLSYSGTVPRAVYDALRDRPEGRLTDLRPTETGYLAVYWDGGTYTAAEADATGQVVCTAAVEAGAYSAPCSAAWSDETALYILSYDQPQDRVFLQVTDKDTGAQETHGLAWADLGADGEAMRMGGFLWDIAGVWVEGDVLYFAQTHYGAEGRSVLAAYDLAEGRARSCTVLEDAQVVDVCREGGTASVLVSRPSARTLEVLALDGTGHVSGRTELALPHAFLAWVQDREGYWIFTADLQASRAAVLLDTGGGEHRESVLCVYDLPGGEAVFQTELTMEADYEIYEVCLDP